VTGGEMPNLTRRHGGHGEKEGEKGTKGVNVRRV
jgi:hypothetical protein